MRDFNIVIPADCIASNTPEANNNALDLMNRVLKADVRASTEIDFDELKQNRDREERNPKVQSPEFASPN
jgi:hypothetical protein